MKTSNRLLQVVLAVMLLALSDANAKSSASSTNKAITKLIELVEEMRDDVAQAAKQVKGSAAYWSRMLKVFSKAQKIGQAYQDISSGRDRAAEEAFDNGWDNGITDAKRLWANPKAKWVDVDWRAYYRRQGTKYEAAYLAGHARGFEHQMRRLRG